MTTSDAHSAWARPDIFNSLCNQATKPLKRKAASAGSSRVLYR